MIKNISTTLLQYQLKNWERQKWKANINYFENPSIIIYFMVNVTFYLKSMCSPSFSLIEFLNNNQ